MSEPIPAAVLAAPLPLDEVDDLYPGKYYGVQVAVLGEDGDDGYIAFTTDRRRAIAAVCADLRWNGDRPDTLTVSDLRWVQVFDHCGCPDHDPDPQADHDDCECHHHGLPPCAPETWAWVYEDATPDAPNALPIYQITRD